MLRRGFLAVLAGAPIASKLEAEVPEMPKKVQDAIRTRHLEEPLDLQVARALGWTDLDKDGYYSAHPPYYSTDWAVTGPLIEKYGLLVGKFPPYTFDGKWYACLPGTEAPYVQAEQHADTPLEAVCLLILELKKAGKL